MAKLFYFSEILKFAIEKETESYALYRKLADLASDKDVKETLQSLMHEEKKHETFYEKMLSSIEKEQSAGVKEDNEYNAYMRELIAASRETQVISDDQLSNTVYALEYAISREKDSIIFYVGLKNYLSESESNQIDTIIAEECRHMHKLFNLKKQIGV